MLSVRTNDGATVAGAAPSYLRALQRCDTHCPSDRRSPSDSRDPIPLPCTHSAGRCTAGLHSPRTTADGTRSTASTHCDDTVRHQQCSAGDPLPLPPPLTLTRTLTLLVD